jgi:CRISPR-associated Csx10 family RAMP protein
MIGGKKTSGNYNKSLNNFSGSIFYASVAREVCMRCPNNEIDDILGEKTDSSEKESKRYWVDVEKNENCNNDTCNVKNLCKNFGKIKVGHFYQFDLKPYPMTAKKCKYHPNEHILDMMMESIEKSDGEKDTECVYCKEYNKDGGRVENLRGINFHDSSLKDHNQYSYKISETYLNVTRTAIDSFRKASDKGKLFSYDLLSNFKLTAKNLDINEFKEISENEFVGYIELDFSDSVNNKIINELKSLNYLHIGGMTSIGYGKCRILNSVEKIEKDNKEIIKKRINNFNGYLDDNNARNYIPVMLTSNAYLFSKKMEEFNIFKDDLHTPSSITTKEFQNIIKEAFLSNSNLRELLELEQVYAEYDTIRGFDTSKVTNVLRKPSIVMKAGSVLLFSVSKNCEYDIYEYLTNLSDRGVGRNTEYGFGSIIVCNDFHENYSKRSIKRNFKQRGQRNEYQYTGTFN